MDKKEIRVTVNGTSYPVRPTLGAMIRFKRETGREVTEMDNSFEDACVWIWCCIASAAKHDGLEFAMSVMDFADSITPDEAMDCFGNTRDWQDDVVAVTDGNDEKKSGA